MVNINNRFHDTVSCFENYTEGVSEFLKLNCSELYYHIQQNFEQRKDFKEIIAFFGAYEILEEVNEIIIRKVSNDNIHFDNFLAYFNRCVTNVIRNKGRSKKFMENQKLLLTENLSYLSNQEIITIGNKNRNTQFVELIQKMYDGILSGDNARCQNLINYAGKVISKSKADKTEIAFNKGHIDIVRSTFFFEKGQLNPAHKYINSAIKILSLPDVIDKFGYVSLVHANNLLAKILINRGSFEKGIRLLIENTEYQELFIKMNPELVNNSVFTESRLLIGMFMSGGYFSQSERFIRNAKDDVYKNFSHLRDSASYAYAYLYIDNDEFDSADNIINSLDQGSTHLNSIRFYTAKAELLTCGFKSESSNNLVTAEHFLSIAEKLNVKKENKYFEAIHGILRGYIEKDFQKLSQNLARMKSLGYTHYHNWYKQRVKHLKK